MGKISWGLVGGGRGSQIGPAHRMGATIDGKFTFAAAALDVDEVQSKRFGIELGLEKSRAYGSWMEMLHSEIKKEDKLGLVTIATPNNTHFEICKAFLESGFNVLCEKPMTMTVDEGKELFLLAKKTNKICAVNYGYSGFPLVREMKSIICSGELGKIRLVKAEFAHGHHASAADANNARVRWRYEPRKAGVSAVFADCGIHALHMACFVTGQHVLELSADFVSTIPSRVLEDDAMINFRMTGGTIGRLWSSAIAVGRQHGLTLQVFGEKGGLRWSQEHPNQLYFTRLGERCEIIERGDPKLSKIASESSRLTIGHSEGMPLAFANIYLDLAREINAMSSGHPKSDNPIFPNAEDGLRSVAAIHAAKFSAENNGTWISAIPDILKNECC